ncbi:hypothetical protein [Jeotgalibacillus marinus]|uniref:Uncharacterized protein n=1 Tax=Jeotgalibacillus marinus TaxID=86667 RepID=A0ABV3Q6I9_9BACL
MNEVQIHDWLKKNNAPFVLKLKVMELFQTSTLLVEFDKKLMEKEAE